jgi:hypothetical protein
VRSVAAMKAIAAAQELFGLSAVIITAFTP